MVSATDILSYLRKQVSRIYPFTPPWPASVGLYNKEKHVQNATLICYALFIQVLFRAMPPTDNLDNAATSSFEAFTLFAVYATPFYTVCYGLPSANQGGLWPPNG